MLTLMLNVDAKITITSSYIILLNYPRLTIMEFDFGNFFYPIICHPLTSKKFHQHKLTNQKALLGSVFIDILMQLLSMIKQD